LLDVVDLYRQITNSAFYSDREFNSNYSQIIIKTKSNCNERFYKKLNQYIAQSK